MADLLYYAPSKILLGMDTLNRLPALVKKHGSKVLLITEAILYERNIIQKIQEYLENAGIDVITFDEVVPNATSRATEDAIRLAKGSYTQVIVGVGGIRTLSCARCTAAAMNSDKHLDDILVENRTTNVPTPFIAVPSTNRDPFLFNNKALITDARDRTPHLVSVHEDTTKAVLIDPRLSLSLPTKYTATILAETLLTAIEGYISNKATFFSDTLFLKVIPELLSLLESGTKEPENVAMRTHAARMGILTSMGLAASAAGIGSAIAYSINSLLMIPKSWVSSVLLPHIIDYHSHSAGERLGIIAGAAGIDTENYTTEEAITELIEKIREQLTMLELPLRFYDFDIQVDDLTEVPTQALQFDMMNYIPRVANTEDVYDLLKRAQ